MKGIELEEGEAYFLQDGDDDDENLDPDKDFSYIDKKIENVLGHYQKDFMGGLCAESLGARYGGYGSFLQRSPPILSNPTTQNRVSSKSPQCLSSEHFHQKPSATENHSLPARHGVFSNDHDMQASSEPGVSLTNKQIKLQSSGEDSFGDQLKKPVIHHGDQSSLKLRVKMPYENVSSFDNSAIYSGLGLDMSPSSSPEDSPAEYDRTSPGMKEKKEESPSCIVQIMTSCALLNDVLLSPLDDSLILFMGMEKNLETDLPVSGQELPSKGIDGNTFPEEKLETRKERNSKLDKTSKDKKLKQKESIKDGKSKQKFQSMKVVELTKDKLDYPVGVVALPATRREVNEISGAMAVVSKSSFNAANAQSEVMELAALRGSSNSSKPSIVLDNIKEFGHLEEVSNKLKQDRGAKARDKSKGEFVAVPSHNVGMGGEGNVNTSTGKTEKDKSVPSRAIKDPSDRRDGVVRKEGEANKFLKQYRVTKEKAKEVVLNSLFPEEEDLHKKENTSRERTPTDTEVDFVSKNDLEENDKRLDISQEKKGHNVGTFETPKKSHLKAISNSQMGAGVPNGKEHSAAAAKKKSKEFHADDGSATEPPRESLIAEDINVKSRNDVPSRSKKGDIDLYKEMRKGKEVDMNEPVMGASEREMHAINRKLKESSNNKKRGFALNTGSNMERDVTGAITVMDKAPIVSMVPGDNSLLIKDDWVQCERCQKWRLLPFGRNPALLPKEWICKMLDWLPGMNKCSISEEETTNALYAMYQLQFPGCLVQNNQQGYPDGGAPPGASAGIQPISLPTQAANIDGMPVEGNGRNWVRTEKTAARQSNFQELDIPVNKDQNFGENRNLRNPRKPLQESDVIRKNGDDRSSKSTKKRAADFEASGTPKKMKKRSMQNSNHIGVLTAEVKDEGQGSNPVALQISEDFTKGFPEPPLMKSKDRTQDAMASRVGEKKDGSGKKRKLKDQSKTFILTEEFFAKGAAGKISDTERRKDKKEKKSKASNFQAREGHTDEGNSRIHIANCNFVAASDNSLPNGRRINDMPLEKHHTDRASRKTVNGRRYSEKAHDLGLVNATTSSSSKISSKVKAKAHEVKCSSVGSISSSPVAASKSDPDKNANKISVSYDEPEEMLSAKHRKSRAEGASNEAGAPNEEVRARKSILSKTSGVMFYTSDDDHFAKNISSGRLPSTHGIYSNPKADNHAAGKADMLSEGTSTSVQNFVSENHGARSLNRLHVDETTSQRGKLHVSDTSIKKELSCHSPSLLKLEEGSDPNAIRVDKASLRHPHPPRNVSRDIGASTCRTDSFYRAAKTALKEATALKHSANRLKKSGSGLESTEVFFQAALKFLHGASLLEPENSENGRCGEMSPSDVYSTTAKLCEYCAREYERLNDMASAALAYKCMEVAYMRVVYSNDLAASRDRLELQMAIRAAPPAESPSSSASDVDNLNNQAAMDAARFGEMEHRNHVISAGNRPNFMRLLDFTKDINLAMEASRRSQSAFAAASSLLAEAGNEDGISCVKRVLDFSFHDVDGLLHLVRLAMDAFSN